MISLTVTNGYLHGRPSSAKNESNVAGSFLSAEAKTDQDRFQEFLLVPDALTRDYHKLEAGDFLEDDNEDGDQRIIAFPAHTACLHLIEHSLKGNDIQLSSTAMRPTSLPAYAQAYALRLNYVWDMCLICDREKQHYGGRCLYWEHHYFGADRFWASDQSWNCQPGQEWYCADPVLIPHLNDFAASYSRIEEAQSTQARKTQEDRGLETVAIESRTLTVSSLPQELLDHVCTFLFIHGALALSATCRALSSRIDRQDSFWRRHTLRLHGDWF